MSKLKKVLEKMGNAIVFSLEGISRDAVNILQVELEDTTLVNGSDFKVGPGKIWILLDRYGNEQRSVINRGRLQFLSIERGFGEIT